MRQATPRRFELGSLMITANAQRLLNQSDVSRCLMRHAYGDWGELSSEDKAENELSVQEGYRLLSSYRDRHRVKFWIITEADRSATTVLLPEDY